MTLNIYIFTAAVRNSADIPLDPPAQNSGSYSQIIQDIVRDFAGSRQPESHTQDIPECLALVASRMVASVNIPETDFRFDFGVATSPARANADNHRINSESTGRLAAINPEIESFFDELAFDTHIDIFCGDYVHTTPANMQAISQAFPVEGANLILVEAEREEEPNVFYHHRGSEDTSTRITNAASIGSFDSRE